MLLYHNHSLWRVIFQVKGSVIYKPTALLLGLVVAIATEGLCLLIQIEHEFAPALPHHYGILGISSIVVFAVVFRINLAWARYWEAMTQQHFMYSKWADAFAQFCAFAHVTLHGYSPKIETDSENVDYVSKSHKIFYTMQSLKKHFSLLSAVSADRLTHGDTRIMARKAHTQKWEEQVISPSDLRGNGDWAKYMELPEFSPIGELPGRRRRGLVAVAEMPSEPSRESDKEWNQNFLVTERPSEDEIKYLRESTDRVSTVMYWILHDLASVSNDLMVAPPIQSRMYQELSNGMLGFSNSLKIADIPFPFPYAQLLNMVLVAFSCFIPLYTSVFTTSLIASPILAFCFFEGLWCFNAVAKELENPFGCDANGISLQDFHMRFMNNIRELEPAQDFMAASLVTSQDALVGSRPTFEFDDDGLGFGVNHHDSSANSTGPEGDVPRSRSAKAAMRTRTSSMDSYNERNVASDPSSLASTSGMDLGGCDPIGASISDPTASRPGPPASRQAHMRGVRHLTLKHPPSRRNTLDQLATSRSLSQQQPANASSGAKDSRKHPRHNTAPSRPSGAAHALEPVHIEASRSGRGMAYEHQPVSDPIELEADMVTVGSIGSITPKDSEMLAGKWQSSSHNNSMQSRSATANQHNQSSSSSTGPPVNNGPSHAQHPWSPVSPSLPHSHGGGARKEVVINLPELGSELRSPGLQEAGDGGRGEQDEAKAKTGETAFGRAYGLWSAFSVRL